MCAHDVIKRGIISEPRTGKDVGDERKEIPDCCAFAPPSFKN